MPEKRTIAIVPMKSDKDCKGSVRYATPNEEAIVTNAYVSRLLAKPMPASVIVVVIPVLANEKPEDVAASVDKTLQTSGAI